MSDIPLYKIKKIVWEAEQDINGKWLLIDPSSDDTFMVPHSWFVKYFEPMNGRAHAALQERRLYGPFSEN